MRIKPRPESYNYMDTEFSHGYHIEVSCEMLTSRLQAFSRIPDSEYFITLNIIYTILIILHKNNIC